MRCARSIVIATMLCSAATRSVAEEPGFKTKATAALDLTVAAAGIQAGDLCGYRFSIFHIEPNRFTCTRDQFLDALVVEGCTCSMPICRHPLFQKATVFGGHWSARQFRLTDTDYTKVRPFTTEAIRDTCTHFTVR